MVNNELLNRIMDNPELYAGALRISFKAFISVFHSYVWRTPFIFRPFHDRLIERLERVVFEAAKRPINLYVGMPPRFGKSQIIKYFIAWTYALNPMCNYIYISYSDGLVLKASKEVRGIITSELFGQLFGLQLDAASGAGQLWKIQDGGEMRAVTMQGGITGFGAGTAAPGYGGALIIDDYLNATDAGSTAEKTRANNAYIEAIKSRRNAPEKTPIIIIAQRLATDDLIGYIEEHEREDWDFLLLQGYDEATGESAWEARMPARELEKLKVQAPGVFAAQYQQNPIVAGGDVFKSDWWRFYDPNDNGYQYSRVFMCADTAMKTGEQNDYTVLGVFGVLMGGGIHLLDMVRGKFEAPELERVFCSLFAKWKDSKRPGLPRCSAVYIEDKASGTGLIQSVKRQGLPVLPIRPARDKYTRALEAVPTIAAGNLYLPNSAGDPISAQVIAECEAFRQDMSHAHDDIVDVICYGVERATTGGVLPF